MMMLPVKNRVNNIAIERVIKAATEKLQMVKNDGLSIDNIVGKCEHIVLPIGLSYLLC